jgi:hypothetical protein
MLEESFERAFAQVREGASSFEKLPELDPT